MLEQANESSTAPTDVPAPSTAPPSPNPRRLAAATRRRDGKAKQRTARASELGEDCENRCANSARGRTSLATGRGRRGRAATELVDESESGGDFTPRSLSRLASRRARSDGESSRRLPADAPRIAFSGLLPADVSTLRSIAHSLGAAIVTDEEAHSATHVVLGQRSSKGAPGAPKRTVKVLHAILRGAWLLDHSWLLHSLDASALLPEAPFETSAFRGARLARERREAGEAVQPLHGFTLAVVESDPEAKERLRRLAVAAGAILCSTSRAAIWVGNLSSSGASQRSLRRLGRDMVDGGTGSAQLVSAQWLYDSVSNGEAMPKEQYDHAVVA